jgi:hypothetical protein
MSIMIRLITENVFENWYDANWLTDKAIITGILCSAAFMKSSFLGTVAAVLQKRAY